MRADRHQGWLVPIMTLLIGTAWSALLLWEQSPMAAISTMGNGRRSALPPASVGVPAGDLLFPGCSMSAAGC